jgi:predicted amidohydrolase YtcJ
VHAIGDRANNIILDAFEKALEGANVSALRPRLEHAQMMTAEDMIRLGKLGGECNINKLQSEYLLSLC